MFTQKKRNSEMSLTFEENEDEDKNGDDDLLLWESLPESLLLQILMYLSLSDIGRVSCVCHKWNRIAQDEFLWKHLLYKKFTVDRQIQRPSWSISYKDELKRLVDHAPLIEAEVLSNVHTNQVLHVSFAHNGKMFASCSRDGFVKVWSTETQPTRVKFSTDMKNYSWNYTQFSQFNESDTLLLVSGVHFGPHTASGEIAVFNIEDGFQLQCRVLNKPYDIFGTWYTDDYLISGRLHFLDHLISCSALWLNKAWQESESERKPIIKRLFKFYNKNASSIRTVMVANCLNDLNDDDNIVDEQMTVKKNSKVSKPTRQSSGDNYQRGNRISGQYSCANRLKAIQTPPSYTQQIDYYGAQTNEQCTMESPIRYSTEYHNVQKRKLKNIVNDEDTDSGDSDFDDPPLPWNEDWLKLSDDEHENQYQTCTSNNSTTNTKDDKEMSSCSSSRSPTSEEDSDSKSARILCPRDKLLIFTTGSCTYTPHQIGIKRIKPFKFQEFIIETATLSQRIAERKREEQERENMILASPNWQDEEAVAHFFDDIDYIIDLRGHIIGMGLSPDHRYLYVNSRSWPENAIIENPLHPPPIAQQIDIHVIDLVTFKPVGNLLRSHKAYTPNDECFFIFLDVSEQFVSSGAEDNHGYIWDRHYGNCLAKLPHNDIVNSVAFNPVDSEMLVTASDDFTLKIWRSRNAMRKQTKSNDEKV